MTFRTVTGTGLAEMPFHPPPPLTNRKVKWHDWCCCCRYCCVERDNEQNKLFFRTADIVFAPAPFRHLSITPGGGWMVGWSVVLCWLVGSLVGGSLYAEAGQRGNNYSKSIVITMRKYFTGSNEKLYLIDKVSVILLIAVRFSCTSSPSQSFDRYRINPK